jgi:uncharacterized membrane protein
MVLAALFISGRSWILPAALILGAGLILLLWGYGKANLSPGARFACVLLKLAGIAALGFCLLEPLWITERAKPGANYFAVVADNSMGMQVRDRGEKLTRGEQLREWLTGPKDGWRAALDLNFQTRRYFFDTRLESSRDFSELKFDGRSSALVSALQSVRERYQGQPLAGILLLTDGNATDAAGGSLDLSGLPPVYPVLCGRDEPIQDIGIQKVAVTQTVFEDAPVTVQADVRASGYQGRNVIAQLIEIGDEAVNSTNANGIVVASQTTRAASDKDPLVFRFQTKPRHAGLSFFKVRVAAGDELAQFDSGAPLSEATLANNSQAVAVDRGRGPYRILYVAGRPNWEYKFLNRALAEDDQVQMVALIRIAKREPKFEFRGRGEDGSNNPLFRGLSANAEEVERYDQPVVVRLNTRDSTELQGGFPKTEEDLYSYNAVIMDDIEAEFFTQDQLALLRRFVSERGGGFAMFGGADSFDDGKYDRTPVADLLPVYLGRGARAKGTENWKLNLTPEGWLEPWMRVRTTESEEKLRLSEMPPFLTANFAREIKPGASVVATITSGSESRPALAVQRYGNGRVGALLIGDMWHWGLQDEKNHADMDKNWRQLIRWLVADVPNRIDARVVENAPGQNGASLIQVRVRDPKFKPLDNASVTVEVDWIGAGKTNSPVRLTAEPASGEAGLYEAAYVPRETGGYRARVAVTNEQGNLVGTTETGWTSDPAAEEFRSLQPNKALLAEIARKTGGEMVASSSLESFARGLPDRRSPVTEQAAEPLWNRSFVFLFALLCFVSEWGIRRWKGVV